MIFIYLRILLKSDNFFQRKENVTIRTLWNDCRKQASFVRSVTGRFLNLYKRVQQ